MTPYTLDRASWEQRTLSEQLGNIGSEVGRAFIAKRAGQHADSEAAMVRALDLIDATVVQLVREHSARAREVLRAREEFLRVLLTTPFSERAAQAIDQYFFQYALAARLQR